ncbi:hypothetical protein ACES2L_07930 [Bdellovibrio bacteriovorus]
MLKKIFGSLIVIALIVGCTEKKEDEETTDSASSSGSDAPKVYNGSQYLGKMLGFIPGGSLAFITEDNMVVGIFAPNGYPISLASETGSNGTDGCYYVSNDCSGTCYVLDKLLLSKSVISNGANFAIVPPASTTAVTLTTNSKRSSWHPYLCTATATTSNFQEASETWTPSFSFPLTDLKLEY